MGAPGSARGGRGGGRSAERGRAAGRLLPARPRPGPGGEAAFPGAGPGASAAGGRRGGSVGPGARAAPLLRAGNGSSRRHRNVSATRSGCGVAAAAPPPPAGPDGAGPRVPEAVCVPWRLSPGQAAGLSGRSLPSAV